MRPQVRVPISFDLDLVKADKIVTSDNKVVMIKVNGKESIVSGYMMIAHLNGEALECISFKNGKHGCADIVDHEKLQTNLVYGNILASVCVPHKIGEKALKVEVFVSDKELVSI